jgi:hypothetical protein
MEAAAGVALLSAGALHAQDVIATDRPGLGFNAGTVPRGAVQVEVGLPAVALDAAGGADTRLINFPALVRIGITRRVELRAGSPVFNIARTEEGGISDTREGAGTLEVGAKIALRTADGGAVPVALIPSVVLPVGDDAFAPDDPVYTLNGVATLPIDGAWSLTTVIGGSLARDAEDDYTPSGALVGVLGRALAERTSGYVEAGWYPASDAADPAYVGAGIAWLLAPLVQLDAFADRGVTDAASDWVFGAGASLRF